MKTCRVCGHSYGDKEFFKIKHLYKYINFGARVWCKPCQRMYIDMKKLEVRKKLEEEMAGHFCVVFP